MKKFLYSLAAVALLGTAATAQNGESENCGFTKPQILNNMELGTADYIGGAVWSTAPTLRSIGDGNTAFPTTEFLITMGNYRGSNPLTANGDFTILGSSIDGIFNPGYISRYGISLNIGDTLRTVAIGYDINQIRNLVDSLLTGSNAQTSCCNVVDLVSPGFCTTLAQSNIESGADINNLSQVLDVFDLFSTDPLTINGLISSMTTVNNAASFLTGGCGGSLMPICFGVRAHAYHHYEITNLNVPPVAVQALNEVTNFVVFPNPSSNGSVNVLVETAKTTDLQVNVYNALGQRAVSQNLGAINGQHSITVNTANLSAGVYMVELTDGTNKQVSKLVIN